MKYIPYSIIIGSLLIITMASCGVERRLKKADAIYEAGGYDKSAGLYRKVAPRIKDKERKAAIFFKSGEAYRLSGNAAFAVRGYDQAIRNNYPNPIVFLRNAEMSLVNDNVEKAQKQLESFRELEPDNRQGAVLQQSLDLVKSGKTETPYKVENVKEFNSRYHDFAPTFGSSDYETVLFTSSRREGKGKIKTYEVTGQKNADIFKVTLAKKGWQKPEPLDDAINTGDEEGASVFNYNYTTLYFTRCRQERGEKYGCSIMLSKAQGDSWSEAENLQIVSDSLLVAHPALSSDGLTMYLSSNIFGGYGGSDLWQISRGSEDDNLWSEPVNLGDRINTPGNEVFPSVRKDTLFFASDGHPGYGGLDIYKAYKNESGIWTVENMGKPINSNADDFGIVFENENERGYFSSRRKGGRGGDDIYSFRMDIPVIEYFLKGVVRDAKTNALIARAEVVLSGSDGTSLKRTTEKDGSFQFRLSGNTDYIAVARRDGYFAQKSGTISTEGITESKTFTEKILMVSFREPVEIPNIFFEFGKADLSKESTGALDELIALMNDNPKIIVSLIAHTDNRGTEDANMQLSQRRAQAVVDYLIINGIDEERLSASGMGESTPRTVTAAIAQKYPFLKAGQTLSEEFINGLENEQKEICHALNRRTEIQVLSDNFNIPQ
ncbi:MAG: OmpA family protein [Prevotellaceae bacterium]|jgi:peptidoglycan-associated lipoprotein|nr:OmpA family protein [Prevotellaceae bacterium]